MSIEAVMSSVEPWMWFALAWLVSKISLPEDKPDNRPSRQLKVAGKVEVKLESKGWEKK